MTNRELMAALFETGDAGLVPQWLMAFESIGLAEKLVPDGLMYKGYAEFPGDGGYGLDPMGANLLEKQRKFNAHIDKCAFPVGWGANAAFGHSGPGEYLKRVSDRSPAKLTLEYETGVRKDVHFDPHFTHIYNHPVASVDDVERIVLPDPVDPSRYAGVRDDIAWAKGSGEWTVAYVNGFFSSIHYFFREYQQFFIDFYDNRDLLKRLLKINGEWTLGAAEMLCLCGIDCIGFCDDLGSGTSMLISPDAYREYILPWHIRICEMAHSYGVKVHMHSHGCILPILKDLRKTGIDILNPLDPDEGMDLETVRELVGSDMVLCGGIDKHFFDWPREIQEKSLEKTIETGRASGPYILMDSGGIPGNVTKDDFEWFLRTSAAMRGSR